MQIHKRNRTKIEKNSSPKCIWNLSHLFIKPMYVKCKLAGKQGKMIVFIFIQTQANNAILYIKKMHEKMFFPLVSSLKVFITVNQTISASADEEFS